MQIFGSDGFRCEFGTSFLSFESITRFANSLGEYYLSEGFSKPLLITKDTRESGKIIEGILINILTYKGIDTCTAGVLPTSGLSKILEFNDYEIGCMITASHNPHHDNGIKLLQEDGFKIGLDAQEYIEELMLSDKSKHVSYGKKIGIRTTLDCSFDEYANQVFKVIKPKEPNCNILVDCSNGSYSFRLEELLSFKNLLFQSNAPNGNNINLNCGALEANKLHRDVLNNKKDFGIAFDGDGDRAIFVSKNYGIIETEKIALLFFKMLSKEFKVNKIVTTEISNLALKHNIENLGGTLIETSVGDRFVIDSVNENDALFGFEQSGHFYFPKYSRSMDGMIAMIHFFNLLNYLHKEIDSYLLKIPHYERVQKNFDISRNLDINIDNIAIKISKIIDSKKEKFIIRKSMWDPVLRIYYDFSDNNKFFLIENIIDDLINNQEIKHI